jgi:predicted aspartyl protease
MQIRKKLIIEGSRQENVDALIDTGASVTLLPKNIADKIGVKYTGETQSLGGAFEGLGDVADVAVVNIRFPFLNNLNYLARVAVSAKAKDILIGLDILNPLSIIVDTKTHELRIKNESADAIIGGLALVGVGAIAYLVLNALFGKKK